MKKGVRAMSLLGLPSLLHKGFCKLEIICVFLHLRDFVVRGLKMGFPCKTQLQGITGST